jgi:hypothetical protein
MSKDITSNKQNELKKIADLLFKTNDKHMRNFLHQARKQNQQWLLDYCYQEAVKHYFSRKIDNQNQRILDWAINCLQPEKILKPLFEKTPLSHDFYFITHKLSLALRVGSVPTIKLLTQENHEGIDALEWLIRNKKAAVFKKLLPYYVKQQLLSPEDFISLLKLALINTNVRAAKIILKVAPYVSEMIKTRGEELFADVPDHILINAKLLNYWQKKVVKINAMSFRTERSKTISFFNQMQGKKSNEERCKFQVAEKLIKRLIANDHSVVLTDKDLHLIKKSKQLKEIYNTSIGLLERNNCYALK